MNLADLVERSFFSGDLRIDSRSAVSQRPFLFVNINLVLALFGSSLTRLSSDWKNRTTRHRGRPAYKDGYEASAALIASKFGNCFGSSLDSL